MSEISKPRFGIGTVVGHPHFGRGRVVAYETEGYVVLFKGGETKRVAFSFDAMKVEEAAGDPESDRIKQAMR